MGSHQARRNECLLKELYLGVIKLPKEKTIGCKWVYIVKFHSDGTLERNKAKVVAKEYAQTYEIDYYETFAHMVKMNTVRVILSITVNLDWSLQQFDVNNVFLHGNLTEEVYMELLLGSQQEERYVT